MARHGTTMAMSVAAAAAAAAAIGVMDDCCSRRK